jgi:hypothetical protein
VSQSLYRKGAALRAKQQTESAPASLEPPQSIEPAGASGTSTLPVTSNTPAPSSKWKVNKLPQGQRRYWAIPQQPDTPTGYLPPIPSSPPRPDNLDHDEPELDPNTQSRRTGRRAAQCAADALYEQRKQAFTKWRK